MSPSSEPARPQRVGGSCLRVGCCAYSYRDYLTGKLAPAMAMEGFLDRAAEIGINGVELTSYYFPEPITPGSLHRLARRAWMLGLDITGTAVGNTFALPPGPDREKQLALVRRWIELTPELGGRYIRVFAGPAPEGVDESTARGWVVDCLRELCPEAGKRGLVLALENHGGVVALPEGMLEIVRQVDSEWFGVNMDTGNFHTPDPYADLAQLAPYTVTTHVKTEMHRPGVREAADLPRIVGILREAGYRGYLHLEYEAEEDAAAAVPRVLKDLLALAD